MKIAMRLHISHGATECWRRGQVVMSGPFDVDLPNVVLRGVWIESPDPETHRVADITRKACPADAQHYLDAVDAMCLDGSISFLP